MPLLQVMVENAPVLQLYRHIWLPAFSEMLPMRCALTTQLSQLSILGLSLVITGTKLCENKHVILWEEVSHWICWGWCLRTSSWCVAWQDLPNSPFPSEVASVLCVSQMSQIICSRDEVQPVCCGCWTDWMSRRPHRGRRTLWGLGGSLCCGQDVSAYRKADGIKIPEARCVDHLISRSIP